MKKCIWILLIPVLIFRTTLAQKKAIKGSTAAEQVQAPALNPEKLHDLFLLGKVWGFLKYFHPGVAGGTIDWDKELTVFLPGYMKVTSEKERNDSILAWVDRLGVIPEKRAGDYAEIKNATLRPDFSWISGKNFGGILQEKLQYILDNRKQGDQYYIKFYNTEGLHIPIFQNEKGYVENTYPAMALRLIALYRFWNIIEYWYPYKYHLPVAWDTVLLEQIPVFLQASNAQAYTVAIKGLLASIHDGHGFLRSVTNETMLGYYYMPVRFRYVQQKVIISAVLNDTAGSGKGLAPGDIIESIDGISTEKMILQDLPYTSGSTKPYQLYSICLNLNRTDHPATVLQINDGGKLRKVTVANNYSKKPADSYIPAFPYQRDSSVCFLKNKVMYLNMGKITMEKDSARITGGMEQCRALIIDARQNAPEDGVHENGIGLLEKLLCNGQQPYIFSTGQPRYAGIFKRADSPDTVFRAHPVVYTKPIVILINEEAISVGEFMSALFSQAPHAVLMGTPTAGADGPVTYLTLPGNVFTMFTGTGIYWKDGSEMQRVGIRPQIEVRPTIKGFKMNRDELLETAENYLLKKIQ